MIKKTILSLLVFLCGFGALAAPAQESPFRSTKYPLPRYVSLRADEVYVRSGPGERYPVKWIYRKNRLPVEIILEYENWRKIRDFQGEEGWVHQSLLSGNRTGLIRSEDGTVNVYEKPDTTVRLAARAENLAVVDLKKCQPDWCNISASGYGGWVQRKFIWGVYADENFD